LLHINVIINTEIVMDREFKTRLSSMSYQQLVICLQQCKNPIIIREILNQMIILNESAINSQKSTRSRANIPSIRMPESQRISNSPHHIPSNGRKHMQLPVNRVDKRMGTTSDDDIHSHISARKEIPITDDNRSDHHRPCNDEYSITSKPKKIEEIDIDILIDHSPPQEDALDRELEKLGSLYQKIISSQRIKKKLL
jgi:hypothetical protein